MDAVQEVVEQDTDEMRQDIDTTRSAMSDKLEALEEHVMGTVQSAQETVEDSIQLAKDTVASVKRNFDIKYQIVQHPVATVGGCFLVGLALGALFLRGRSRSQQSPKQPTRDETPPTRSPRAFAEHSNGSYNTAATLHPTTAAHRPVFFGQFQEDIDKVKGMAIGYVMGLVRDSVKDAVPQLASQIEEVMNSITAKLGSKPVPQQPR